MLKRNFGGSLPLYVLVKGDEQDPQVLQEIKKVEDFLKSLEDVHNPQSIVDIMRENRTPTLVKIPNSFIIVKYEP